MTLRQTIPTVFTLAAMLCGFFSILLSFEGPDHYVFAAQLIMLAMILDGLDGTLARKLKASSEFGAELDTYVDMTAFGLAPATLIYQVSLQGYLPWRILMTAVVVLSGVIRLAMFKVRDPARGQAGYRGLPITASAGWVAIFVFLTRNNVFDKNFSLNNGPVAALFLTGVAIMITLQVSNVRYPKPTKTMFIFVPCVLLVLLLFLSSMRIDILAAIGILILGVCYVVFGPMFVKIIEKSSRVRAGRGGLGTGE